MKECINCKEAKEPRFFGKCSKNKDGLNSSCKECKRVYDNNFHKNRSLDVKQRKLTLQNTRRLKSRQYMYEYLSDRSCVDCGEKRVATLDFDHIRDKEFNICDGVRYGFSLEKIKKEIAKCEIRCANCHRVKTALDHGWYDFKNISGCDPLVRLPHLE